MSEDKTDGQQVDIGKIALKKSILSGESVFSYEDNHPERLVQHQRNSEEKEFAKHSCWDTASAR